VGVSKRSGVVDKTDAATWEISLFVRRKFSYHLAMVGRPRVPLTLTNAERATLRRWAGSRNASQALALRARIVLSCECTATITGVAAELGVSREMVSTWRSRFLVDRLEGLRDAPRSGRPRAVPDAAADQVLRTMLRRPPGDGASWSTRSVAAATGLSQTAVSRIWRTWWPGPATSEGQAHELVGAHFGSALRVLALCRPADPPARVPRAGLTTVLAAAEYCHRPSAAPVSEHSDTPGSLHAFLAVLDREVPAAVDVRLVVDGESLKHGGLSPGLLAGWRRQHRFQVEYTSSRSGWHRYARNALGLAEVAERIHQWHDADEREFTWVKRGPTNSTANCGLKIDSLDAVAAPSGPGDPTPEDQQRLADQVVHVLRESIASGRFAAGERITEAPLASRLGVSRGPVRDALRVLAEDGLLELQPNRGAVVPMIRATDVLETYASRAVLGMVLLRRLTTLEPAALQRVGTALDEVRAAVRHGDMRSMVEADTRFQDAFADAARLPRTALHFRRLSMQLRMFVSILGLDYASASDRIVRQDAAIFDALRNRSGNDAVRRWRAKIEYMVRYMTAQLPQEDFDSQLWLTITGSLGE
jgi:DNA-binding GntR family transcriptional regulator/transposase